MNCTFDFDNCEVSEADLSKKSIDKIYKFSGSRTEKEAATGVRFLKSNKVVHIPLNIFQEFSNLIEFSIWNSGIQTLRNDLFRPEFSKIEELSLVDNGIAIIEENAFLHLTSLEVINLEHNKIQSLSNKFFEKNLKLSEISLRGNKIRIIEPQTFKNLNRLSRLDLKINDCVHQIAGLWNFDTKIDHAELNRELKNCYDNYHTNLDFLNEGEIIFSLSV